MKLSNIPVRKWQDYVIMIISYRKIGIHTNSHSPMRIKRRHKERQQYSPSTCCYRANRCIHQHFCRVSGQVSSMQRDVTDRHISHWSLKRVELMRALVWSQLSIIQRHYKCHNKNITEPKFKVVNFQFVDPNQPADIASDSANGIANHRYNELLWQTCGVEKYSVFNFTK